MRRSALFLLVLFAGVVLAAAPAAHAQRNFDDVVITPLKLADGLWMLTGSGGNLLVCAGPDGALLVDTQYGPLAARIRAVTDSLGGGRPLRFVLNTHYHGDHVSGDSAMAAAGATIVAHANVRRRMSVDRFNETFRTTTKAAPVTALPVLTFSDSLTFHLNGHEVRVLHLPPGHTDGDAVVWVPAANVLHTGDLLFNGTYPVIDVSAGGSIGGMIRSLDLLLPLVGPATQVVPGHGPLADRAALLRFRSMLVTVRDRVTKLVKEGRTFEQVMAAKPLADLDRAWGTGFMKPDAFLQVVYRDLSREPPAPLPDPLHGHQH
jgi:glyoxylase-like metal-dependent hydrolase (beta-lactamase superfamily II)